MYAVVETSCSLVVQVRIFDNLNDAQVFGLEVCKENGVCQHEFLDEYKAVDGDLETYSVQLVNVTS